LGTSDTFWFIVLEKTLYNQAQTMAQVMSDLCTDRASDSFFTFPARGLPKKFFGSPTTEKKCLSALSAKCRKKVFTRGEKVKSYRFFKP